MKAKLKQLINLALSYLPSNLPVGMEEFSSWSSDIIALSGMPDNDSIRWALAVQIQHCGQTESRKPKQYFVRCLRKGAANQVASYVFVTLKEKQKAEQEAAAEQARLDEALKKGQEEAPNPTLNA